MKKKKTVAAILLCLILAGFALVHWALPGVQRNLRENGRSAIKEAVLRSAMECYAVEGVYPDSLDYLEKNYGLVINHRAYIVSYEVFASNVLPDVLVLVRGEG